METHSQHVTAIRLAYAKALTQSNPSRPQLEWRLSRFDRGIKLVSEIEALGKSVYGSRVVDLGAAHGGDCCALVAFGAWTVAADFLDYDYMTIRQHIEPAAQRPASFAAVLTDVNRKLPFSDSVFNVVLAMGVIEHVKDLETFFQEIYRVLRLDGFAILDVHVALKSLRSDPIFNSPATGVLPMPLRRFVAERLLRRTYPFPLAHRTFYSAGIVARPATRAGFHVRARKYRDSPIAARVSRWPLSPIWRALIERYAFDFLLLEKRR